MQIVTNNIKTNPHPKDRSRDVVPNVIYIQAHGPKTDNTYTIGRAGLQFLPFDLCKTEYGSEGRVSTKGDVYSYGIMLMETFTRKKPTHEMFVGGLSLRQWVDSSFPDLIMEVVDANLLARDQNNTNGNLQTCLLSIMGLGLQCSLDSPEQRLDMKEVVVRLSKIRQQYISQT